MSIGEKPETKTSLANIKTGFISNPESNQNPLRERPQYSRSISNRCRFQNLIEFGSRTDQIQFRFRTSIASLIAFLTIALRKGQSYGRFAPGCKPQSACDHTGNPILSLRCQHSSDKRSMGSFPNGRTMRPPQDHNSKSDSEPGSELWRRRKGGNPRHRSCQINSLSSIASHSS